MRMKRLPFLLMLLLLASACQAQPATPAATSSLPTLRAALPADLAWLGDPLNACAQEVSVGIVRVAPGQPADVQLLWGTPPAGSYASELGSQAVEVVVNPQNPVDEIDLERFQAIFGGQTTRWDAAWLQDQAPAGEEIEVWSLNSAALGALVPRLRADAALASDPATVRAAVAASPSAVGLLPAAWLDRSVKPLQLKGFLTAQGSLPILAVTAAEPQGSLRDWLVCLDAAVP